MQAATNLLVTKVQRYCIFETAEMKIAVLVSFFLVGLAHSTPVETSESSEITKEERILKSLHNYLSKKCASENDSTHNATEIMNEIAFCFEAYMPRSPEQLKTLGKPGSSYDICESPEKIQKIPECFLPVIDLWKACSDDEEKYLPEFLIDAVKNIINFLCADEGKNIEKIYQISATECLTAIDDDRQTSLKACTDEAEGFIALIDDGILTKKELCDTLEAEKACYSNYVKKLCPDDSNLKEFLGDFVDALASSCSK